MRSTLYLKFIIMYIIFGFLCLFVVGTISSELTISQLETDLADSLNKEANVLGTEYLPKYFSQEISPSDLHTELVALSSYDQASLWVVSASGEMITYAKPDGTPIPPNQIDHFNPAEFGSSQYKIGTYHDYFDEDVLTIITPITEGYTTKGYLLIHKPYSSLTAIQTSNLNIIYITVMILFVISLLILMGIHFFIYVPLHRITEAATQYASGNLNHEIRVTSHDEMGYLSASLNYMSSQLKDLEDYQKKFIGNVSHDFRSPLTSIKGYIEAMVDGTIPPELHEKYLKIILFETERLTDLTQDLLALNEFDTKQLLLNIETFDLHEMIKRTATSFEGTCTSKKISIELLLASKNMYVYGDRRKIQQVLYNLLDNAIKFSEQDSTVTIETTIRGEKVFTSVKDRGIGIPKDSVNKVWDRFYKSDLSRGKDKKGTGLGLSIVKEIINAHDENITVISTEGVGTEFSFSLKKSKESI